MVKTPDSIPPYSYGCGVPVSSLLMRFLPLRLAARCDSLNRLDMLAQRAQQHHFGICWNWNWQFGPKHVGQFPGRPGLPFGREVMVKPRQGYCTALFSRGPGLTSNQILFPQYAQPIREGLGEVFHPTSWIKAIKAMKPYRKAAGNQTEEGTCWSRDNNKKHPTSNRSLDE